jgi:hypothetical protein
MKNVILFGLMCAGFLLAEDGKTITSRTGCQLTVPASWTGGTSLGNSPDKKVSAVVSSRTDAFPKVKQTAKMVYEGSKVTKDSDTEFEMEGKSLNGKPNVYRAVPSGGKFCIAEVIYESGTLDDAKRIIETLK